MTSSRMKFPALALAGLVMLGLGPTQAAAQTGDAARSAEFTARTSVQTIYQNLVQAGYDWNYIKNEKMPEILVRAVDAIERETSSFDKRLILGTFIPTFIRSFYDEIDKLNEQNQVRCIDVEFIEITLVPFVEACAQRFQGKFTVREIVVPVLQNRYTFTVCQARPVCLQRLSTRFNSTFKGERMTERDFENVCVAGS